MHNEFIDFENMLGHENFVVTKLKNGAFATYMEEQKKAGADLAHLKPTHMQAPEKVIKRLLNQGQWLWQHEFKFHFTYPTNSPLFIWRAFCDNNLLKIHDPNSREKRL